MNKQVKTDKQGNITGRGIEWTDYTWNPVGGCQHGCKWNMPDGSTAICYAEGQVIRQQSEKFYPLGFEHHYWNPDRLAEPSKLKTPARIFMDSMSDLMGHWVPDEQIEAVLDVCRQTPQHTYQLLTKNAPRLKQFAFPANVWIGVSVPPSHMFGKPLSHDQQASMIGRTLGILSQLKTPVRWMSIEPLSWDVADYLESCYLANDWLPLEWVVIGAATNGNKIYQPDPAWVRRLLNILDLAFVPVFFKGNLRGNSGYKQWREEFPQDGAK